MVVSSWSYLESWVCEACGKTTDLKAESFKSILEGGLDTAMQKDAQERAALSLRWMASKMAGLISAAARFA